jgi:23S rRNA pseudouridine2605 synthase
MTTKRLSKALAAAGIASRRACEELIFAGRVSVNGTVVLVPQTPVDWETDAITVDGKLLTQEESKVCYLLNKPKGYICSSKKTSNTKIVLDLFEEVDQRLFTVGRLDQDTEGLLIVTNDGQFANRVIHPSSNIHKEYLVKADKELTFEHLAAITNGTQVEGTFVRPVKVTKVRRGTLKIIISEGKKREVRSLLAAAGLETLELTRIRIGSLPLGDLAVGQWRAMTEKDKELIFS